MTELLAIATPVVTAETPVGPHDVEIHHLRQKIENGWIWPPLGRIQPNPLVRGRIWPHMAGFGPLW